jgi:hypothetical protein
VQCSAPSPPVCPSCKVTRLAAGPGSCAQSKAQARRTSQGVSVPIHPAKVLATSTDSKIRAT